MTLYTGMAVGALCIVFATVLLFVLNEMATQNLTAEVTALGEITAYNVGRGVFVNPLPPVSKNLIHPVQVVDPHGRVVAATRDLQHRPVMAHFTSKTSHQGASEVVCHSVFPTGSCHIVVAHQVYRDGDWTIYSAAPTLPFYVYPSVIAILTAGAVIFTIAMAYGARRTVTTSLKPVDTIRAQLDHIKSHNLGCRVPVSGAKDEIHRLACSVNQTLDRLEDTLGQQRRFCADASHELRTPIAAIRVQMEDAFLAPKEVDTAQLCNAVLPSVERLQSITSDLLTLTRLDAGTPCERHPVDLEELVATELSGHQINKKVVQNLTPGVTVMGHRSLLGRLIGNLVQNAQRYASSTVTITVEREEGDPEYPEGVARLEVLDDGAGIVADQREAVFQRFTRLDTARSRDAGGVGLGLPIARQIAENHGGALTVQDSDQGARFVVRLPLYS
ncbi:HAMP domain-containing sensor histidine kinase [Streptosporangium subroseum]|uniref:HAMP domain-containing sensor histidine kinase n=1 Tax=Streptosporangium subroseum TaxID=106412 RepID=UPI0015C607CB|nr:HAMP domain-containing sensor histidine kinase [Streptosporangium subroseum]